MSGLFILPFISGLDDMLLFFTTIFLQELFKSVYVTIFYSFVFFGVYILMWHFIFAVKNRKTILLRHKLSISFSYVYS